MSDETSLNLFQQQEANRRRTAVLVIGFVVFFAWLGFGGDYIYYLYTLDAPRAADHHTFPWFGIVLSLAAVVMAWYAYRTGPEKVLWSTGARESVDLTDPKEKQFVNVVEEMAIAAGVPRPRIWIVDDPDPNAFATGTDPLHAHVAATRGLLDLCTRDELQAVIGHELGHVKNLDVRLMTIVAALAGAVALLADWARRGMMWGGGSRRSDERRSGGGGAAGVVFFAVWIVAVMLAPVVGRMLAMMVSRRREYLADATGAELTRNPLGLARALEKLEESTAPTRAINRGSAHLCIADPLGRPMNLRSGFWSDIFASHPPMASRIAALRQMAFEKGAR